MRRGLLALVVLCGALSGSAMAGGGTYEFGAPGHWGGWWNGGWANFYAEHNYPVCDWCSNPYQTYKCCNSCGFYFDCDDGCSACGHDMGEERGPMDVTPSAAPSTNSGAMKRRSGEPNENWPQATALFPAPATSK